MFESVSAPPNRRTSLIAAGSAIVLIWLSLFTVKETDFVLITQFGRPLYTITGAGLHIKWFFQNATPIPITREIPASTRTPQRIR